MMRAPPMHCVWDKAYTHAKSIVYSNFLYRLLVHRQNNILPFELCDLIYDVCSEWNHENKGWKSLGAFKIFGMAFRISYMLSTLIHSLTHSLTLFTCEIVYLISYRSLKDELDIMPFINLELSISIRVCFRFQGIPFVCVNTQFTTWFC